MNIKDIVKDNSVWFDHYRAGNFYYRVNVGEAEFEFPVPQDDLGEATLLRVDKAIMFMRYIRKALEDKTFMEV